jgi:6-phosphofructokinase 2
MIAVRDRPALTPINREFGPLTSLKDDWAASVEIERPEAAMTVILTLTPNPAIDISTSVDRVRPGPKLRCTPSSRDPGGGGINVARVVGRMGGHAIAAFPCGGSPGRELEQLVSREGVESLVVPIGGQTREDFTVFDETAREEFRFVLPGPRLRDPEWMACLKAIAGFERKLDFICASGSLPPGAPTDFYARVAEIADLKGVPFALDSSGPALKSALSERVHLCKPNLSELRELVGLALEDEASLVEACRTLVSMGRTEVVALTLGAGGALLVTAREAWRAHPIGIEPVSTVGAGDSFLGAMVWALASRLSLEDAFRHGCAAGAAALLVHGTELCRAADLKRLLPQVRIEPIKPQATATV